MLLLKNLKNIWDFCLICLCYFSSEDEASSTVARLVDVFLIEKPKL